MIEAISDIPPPFNMIVFCVLICAVAGVCTQVAKELRLYVCYRAELELKREMVDRGYTSKEIDEVIRSKSPSAAG